MLRPFTVARYGLYAALGVSILSLLLARNSGMATDVAAARSLLIFVIFAALAFGAEAVLLTAGRPAPLTAHPVAAEESASESTPGVEDAA